MIADPTIHQDLADTLADLAIDLDDASMEDGLSADECRMVGDARDLVNDAVTILIEMVGGLHLSRVRHLCELCACTHDRGSHGQDAPHLCEPEDGSVCHCPGFELEPPRRETLRAVDVSVTERAPALKGELQ
ncbi:MAG: hypothetical protein ACREU5_06820 [Burkholderiales bacterium]